MTKPSLILALLTSIAIFIEMNSYTLLLPLLLCRRPRIRNVEHFKLVEIVISMGNRLRI